MSDKNVLEMSDEDIMNQSAPPAAGEAAAEGADAGADDAVDTEEKPDAADAGAADAADPDAADTNNGEDAADDQPGEDGDGAADGADAGDAGKEPDVAADDAKKEDEPAKTEVAPAADTTFAVPTSFKANGKEIKLRDEGEAVKLMQLGANYTKQMQALAPHRKMLMMLQNNDLMDERKLTFLIDINNRDPEAIKKLIKDAGIDPLEIDTSTDDGYIPGNHTVSDEQERFRSVVDDLGSTSTGKETVLMVTQWDQASKDAVWASPEIMTTINEQRESGVFGLISEEIDRRMTLGAIPPGTPFLEAYKNVGMELASAAAQSDGSGSTGAEVTTTGAATPGKVAVTTRAAAPKATVANGDKAAAASAPRSSKTAVKPLVNVLAESDDEFMKKMEGRV